MGWSDAPPSKEELSRTPDSSSGGWDSTPPPEHSEPTQLESFGRGAVDSVTMGSAPKLSGAFQAPVGAAKSLLDLLGANYSDEDVLAYEKARNESKDAFKLAEEANPLSYGSGELAGGVGMGLATMGLGELAVGANGLAKAKAAADAAKKMSVLSKMAASAKVGTGYGAATGLLASDSDSLGGKVADAGFGGVMGGLTGGAMTAVGAGLGKGVKTFAPKIGKAFGMGKAGENVITEAGRREIEDDLKTKTASEIVEKLESYGGELSGKFEELKKLYGDKKISLKDFSDRSKELIKNNLDARDPMEATDIGSLNKLIGNFITAEEKALPASKILDEFGNPIAQAVEGGVKQLEELPVADALKLKRSLQGRSKFERGMVSEQGQNTAGTLAGEIGDSLESNVPGLATANDQSHTMLEGVLNPLKLKGKEEVKAEETVRKALFHGDAESGIGSETRIKMKESLDNLEKINPELSADLRKTFEEVSGKIQTSRAANNSTFTKGGNTIDSITGVGLKGANLAGLSSRVLTSFPKEKLGQLGQHFAQSGSPNMQRLGNALMGASEKDDIGRNAVIFMLMQNETYRDAIKSMVDKKE